MEKPREHASLEAGPDRPLLPPAAFHPPLDWARIFGRRAPVEVDIGSGKGRYVIEAARANPGRDYLGVERAAKWIRFAEEKVRKAGVPNVRLVCVDAAALVADAFPDASVSAYTLHHPDPWPKTRHHKRRIVTPAFAAALARTLVPGGTLSIQSDVKSLFEEIVATVSANPDFEPVPFETPANPDFDGLTSFERKYLKEGRAIHRARLRRR